MIQRGYRLNPNSSLEDKKFYKKFYIIDRDGTVQTRVTLSVPDSSLREELIFKHYLARYVEVFVRSAVGVKVESRDLPWDFEVSLSNGEQLKIELTAIADDQTMFTKMKYEDRVQKLTVVPKITLHELEKLHHVFPDEESLALINFFKTIGFAKHNEVNNPYYMKGPFLFMGRSPMINRSFGDLLIEAINKKVSKSHVGKEDVILIIDNRTVYFDLDSILISVENLSTELESLPFKQVWIYTGYYSDETGNDAEYSLIPIKLSDESRNILNSVLSDADNRKKT